MLRSDFGKHRNITTATTTVVKTGQGVLVSIVPNATTTGTITLYDNTAASGTLIATIAAGKTTAIPYLTQFVTGLTVVTSAADNITVVYS